VKRRKILSWSGMALLAIACSSSSGGKAPVPSVNVFMDGFLTPGSCVLNCDPTCAEPQAPWQCPALADWSAIPHAAACGSFDGHTFPAPVQGACTASSPSGDALAKTAVTGSPLVLPDGRRIVPAGTEWVLSDFPGGFPSNATLVPSSKWLAVVDTGYDTQSVRLVDTGLLRAGGTSPVVASVKYDPPASLNWGVAWSAATNVLYVASGTPDSKVYAYDVDPTKGTLTADAQKTIALQSAFPQAVAISPDGKTLLVGQASDSHVFVVSLVAATYGQTTGTIDLGSSDVFALAFDPNDATTAYATLWHAPASLSDSSKMKLVEINVSGKSSGVITVGKAPEEVAFINARYMVVANALSDSLSIIDRPAKSVAIEVPISTTHGVEPTALAYDPTHKRLYAALSSINAVGAFNVDDTQTPPTITPAGNIPTAWWPTSVTVDPADGALYVTNGKGHGIGPGQPPTTPFVGAADNGDAMSGSIQAVPYMDAAALSAADAASKAANDVGALQGYATVQCNGAPYDFPVPATLDSAGSAQIKHVFFIVRENKTFDAIFGDAPNVDGDPSFTMSPGNEDKIWGNTRAVAAAFAHMDNFYEDAEQSIQGHLWTVFGRTTDYDERRWLVIWGRYEVSVTESPGVADETAPLEGSLFTSLQAQGVDLDVGGELIGGLAFRDQNWPGGTTDATIPDPESACYLAARARVTCDTPGLSYGWFPNDHTFGLAANKPNPAVMISANDEATGMLVDGISHSPIWPESLIIVVEDDPSSGSDHVDLHRSIAVFASPWIKRNYVSHAHYGMSSLHKLIAHVFGQQPYRNQGMADAPLPLDLFTSTPDYTPFTYLPRGWTDASCNASGTSGAQAAERWDFSEPDNQPGLDQQTWDYMRNLAKKKQ
jgi:DNA-binding beta-propeller fold protein YncE